MRFGFIKKSWLLIFNLILFTTVFSFQAHAGKMTCDMSDVQKALGAMLCQDKAFLSGDCGVNLGLEAGAAAIGGALGAYGANYMQLKFLMRDVAEYATMKSFLQSNSNYIDGAGARIQSGALGGSETGTTRSIDAAAFRNIQDSFQDEIAGIKADNEVYRRRIAAIEEKARALGITDMDARVRDFEKSGFLEAFTRNTNGNVDTRKRYRLNSRAARSPGKTRALARALGAGLGMAMATPLAGAVIGAIALEAPIMAYQYIDARNESACAASYGDVSRYLETNASGVASSGACSLTGNFNPDFEEFFKLKKDEQDRLLANPDFCEGLRKAYAQNEVTPAKIAGFKCAPVSTSRNTKTYFHRFTVFTESVGKDGVTRLAPINVEYGSGAITEITTDHYNTVDLQGQPSYDLVTGGDGRPIRSAIDVSLDFADSRNRSRFSRARYAHITDMNGATIPNWQLANPGFDPSTKATPFGSRLRDTAIFKENYEGVLKEMGEYCKNNGNGSNIPASLASLQYGPPDSWNGGSGYRVPVPTGQDN